MKILFITPNLSGNSTGRTYALWLAAEHLGWESRTISIRGTSVWGPVSSTPFAESCSRVDLDAADGGDSLDNAIAWADVVVLVKPVVATLGLYAKQMSRFNKPVLLDIDDPDLESALSVGRPVRALAKRVLRAGEIRDARERAALARSLPTMVSNPSLQRKYGGVVVPHARTDFGAGAPHTTNEPHIAFVGTNNPHKGIGVLRSAVGGLQHLGYRLTVTDTPPQDAKPWESWVGRTSLDEGIELVKRADVIAIPSRAKAAFAQEQLPAKLMDAMIAGRAIVASSHAPIEWALGAGGVLVRPDSVDELTAALATLTNPDRREELGSIARERALDTFVVDAVAVALAAAVAMAVRAR